MPVSTLADSVSVARTSIWKGTSRLVVSDPTTYTSFPGRMESVILPGNAVTGTPYTLASGLVDLGPTTTDGVTVSRSADLSDGIEVDQRQAALDEGEPESWDMGLETVLVHTTLANFQIGWEGGTLRSWAAGAANVAQSSLALDAPGQFTERMAFVIQEDTKNDKMRVFALRKATPAVDSETVVSRTEESRLPVSFTLRLDATIEEGSGQFGVIFNED